MSYPNYAWKWNQYPKDVLPFWIADMDFPPCNSICEALVQFSKQSYYGYALEPKKLKSIICSWLYKNYCLESTEDELLISPGVISAMEAFMACYMKQDDNYITFTPVYPPFLKMSAINGVLCKEVPLKRNDENNYFIDFDSLEKTIDSKTKFILLSNPHNPSGNLWTQEELSHILSIAKRYNLFICSDEIWADIVFDGSFNSFYSLGKEAYDRVVCFFAPSKSFNIAGLNFSYTLIKNQKIKDKVSVAMKSMLANGNIVGALATIAAYTKGGKWLLDTKKKLRENYDYLVDFLSKNLPYLKFFPSFSTYLLWIDCSELKLKNPYEFFLKNKIAFGKGNDFGSHYESFVRLNFACEKKLLEKGLEKMKRACEELNI